MPALLGLTLASTTTPPGFPSRCFERFWILGAACRTPGQSTATSQSRWKPLSGCCLSDHTLNPISRVCLASTHEMNALNIISGLGSSTPPSPARSRTSSLANLNQPTQDATQENDALLEKSLNNHSDAEETGLSDDERTPLVEKESADSQQDPTVPPTKGWRLIPKRFADIVVTSVKVVVSTVFAPVTYIVACFYDAQGNFSAMLPIRRIYHLSPRKRRRKPRVGSPVPSSSFSSEGDFSSKPRLRPKQQSSGVYSAAPAAESSDGFKSELSDENDRSPKSALEDSPAHNTRSKTTVDDGSVSKRSIRIKIQPDVAQKKRHRSHKSIDGSHTEDDRMQAVANALKSPSSPAVTKLKYPRAPAPPRPLVPRRQPSYANLFSPDAPKKTLIVDLDETLIHSMAKGGRMSTGHMVEVKFQGPIGGGGVVLGPQVPILYYVHERPHCHEFLRKVCKWFNLVVFTASVQEYADPVIDWLERERAYFVGRYYRQHCTFRNGAYIKDLAQVEPDLSKVMILDNSPMSYIFHEDNAIPIEGWISDPTDNDLLHLVPFLEGLHRRERTIPRKQDHIQGRTHAASA
ncbi:hypothetical protein K461DRAFT_314541 [Myriangium duriaei CBS 260.36]|uniref:FCP1 homology domain-containing protein n=1 Tax=Myriangium duriaei CBS 260.36 TaxID=1168546 RepID=A0A9P4IV69_9PEZI|nr:hypothetical protein K461DRAFT_314541 [Myriangium duriaei CBS 260.36]